MMDDIIAQAEAFQKWMGAVNAADGKIDGEHVAYCDKCDIEEWLPRLLAEAKAWKAKAIEDRARWIYPFNMPTWEHLPEENTVDRHCPTITIGGKKHWREVAAKELAEEMRLEGKGDE